MISSPRAKGAARPSLWRRFAGHRGGNIAMMFGLAAIPFFVAGGIAVDIGRQMVAKNRLVSALDATALAVGAQRDLTQAKADQIARAYFAANYDGDQIGVTSTPVVTFTNSSVTVSANVTIETLVMDLVNIDTLYVEEESVVQRSGVNLEVAMVLDVTGSMGGQKIIDLRAAATDLVNIVVRDEQTPYFSKVAIVPYSLGVNVGTYADAVRGPQTQPTRIVTGMARSSSFITVTTQGAHGYTNGQKIYIAGVSGSGNLPGAVNAKAFDVATPITTNTFRINVSTTGSYSSGGTVDCTDFGCGAYAFTNASGGTSTQALSSCVSERTGSQAYTDAAPNTAANKVGWAYPAGSGDSVCNSSQIMPLSPNRTLLNQRIASLTDDGYTAGHIGIAWGRYMLSPGWGYLWPAAVNRPLDYNEPELMKIAVIMTDGEFNAFYCNGVIARDATSAGGNTSRINCNAPNGDSFAQARRHCAAMKADGIVIYTVGFALGSGSTAATFMSECASGTSRAYLASNGTQLREAFRNIAIDITNLRVSR